MSDNSKTLLIHAREDVFSIPLTVAEMFPVLKGQIEPVKLDMSAMEFAQIAANDLPSVDPIRQAQCRKMLGLHTSVGKWVDALDGPGRWYHAQIIDETSTQVKVTYAGWSALQDEWIDKRSRRLRSFGSHGKLCHPEKGFIAPRVGDDIGRGRVWNESFSFNHQFDWM